jgi:hypothetical protein
VASKWRARRIIKQCQGGPANRFLQKIARPAANRSCGWRVGVRARARVREQRTGPLVRSFVRSSCVRWRCARASPMDAFSASCCVRTLSSRRLVFTAGSSPAALAASCTQMTAAGSAVNVTPWSPGQRLHGESEVHTASAASRSARMRAADFGIAACCSGACFAGWCGRAAVAVGSGTIAGRWSFCRWTTPGGGGSGATGAALAGGGGGGGGAIGAALAGRSQWVCLVV